MQFLMLIYRDDQPVDDPPEHVDGDVDAWVAEMDGRGVRLAGEPLAPDAAASTVRVRGGQTRAEDGAALDTAGRLIGFDLLDCRDRDEAVEVAAAHPLAARFVIELRPAVSF